MKRIIFLSVFFCLVLGQSSDGEGCGLYANRSYVNLGTQPGCSMDHSYFTVHNTCKKSLIVQISKSDADIELKTSKIVIGAGKEIKIPFSARFPKRLGNFTKTITLAWKPLNMRKFTKTTITVSGTVKDFNLNVQPTKIDLGTLGGGKGIATGLSIKYAGRCSLRVWLSSNNPWIKAFYPSEFTLSPQGGNREEGVFCYLNVPQQIGPFKGTITVKSDAGHRVDVPVLGYTLGLNLIAQRYGQSTVLLRWNNPSKMENKLKKYIIYANGKAIEHKSYEAASTIAEYIFDEYECNQPVTFFIEGIFYSKENRAPLRSNMITFMEPPLNDKLALDCLPIYSTMRDWVFEAGYWEDNGVDFSAAQNMPCQAVFDGTVIASYDVGDDYYKNMVFIAPNHRFSYKGHPIDCVYYAHMNARCVRKGDSVEAGDVIGLSGIANNSPHLHFGICKADPNINWETEGMLKSKRCHEDYDNELVSEILGVWYKKHIIGNCNGKKPEICEKVPKGQ